MTRHIWLAAFLLVAARGESDAAISFRSMGRCCSSK